MNSSFFNSHSHLALKWTILALLIKFLHLTTQKLKTMKSKIFSLPHKDRFRWVAVLVCNSRTTFKSNSTFKKPSIFLGISYHELKLISSFLNVAQKFSFDMHFLKIGNHLIFKIIYFNRELFLLCIILLQNSWFRLKSGYY